MKEIEKTIRKELMKGEDTYIVEAHNIGYNEGWNDCIDFLADRKLIDNPEHFIRYDKN